MTESILDGTDSGARKLGLGPRSAQWIRSRYQRKAKFSLADEFSVSPATAKRWLAGESPTVAHLEEMTALWGRSFVMFIFQDSIREAKRRRRRMIAERIQAAARSALRPFHRRPPPK